MADVYVLKSLKNFTYYIGSTKDLDKRLYQHKRGESKYTSEILPVKLVFKQSFELLSTAQRIERWLKRQKDRDFTERIIREDKITKNIKDL